MKNRIFSCLIVLTLLCTICVQVIAATDSNNMQVETKDAGTILACRRPIMKLY